MSASYLPETPDYKQIAADLFKEVQSKKSKKKVKTAHLDKPNTLDQYLKDQIILKVQQKYIDDFKEKLQKLAV